MYVELSKHLIRYHFIGPTNVTVLMKICDQYSMRIVQNNVYQEDIYFFEIVHSLPHSRYREFMSTVNDKVFRNTMVAAEEIFFGFRMNLINAYIRDKPMFLIELQFVKLPTVWEEEFEKLRNTKELKNIKEPSIVQGASGLITKIDKTSKLATSQEFWNDLKHRVLHILGYPVGVDDIYNVEVKFSTKPGKYHIFLKSPALKRMRNYLGTNFSLYGINENRFSLDNFLISGADTLTKSEFPYVKDEYRKQRNRFL